MSTPRAADLPVGSRVRRNSGDRIAVRTKCDPYGWWVSGIGAFWNYEIDAWLADGAQVLRVGDGSGQ